MPIDIDIAHVAKLARIQLSDEEMASYRAQLSVILDHAAQVQALATDGVPPTSHPLDMDNAFREDVVTESLDRDVVLSQAPDAIDGFFRVPPSLDSE